MPMKNSSKFLIILALTISSCSKPTKLDSDEFSTPGERVEILKQEISCFSEIKDAEFELYNVDGFKSSWGFSAPGLPYLDYKFVIKVDKEDVTKWREGMIKFEPEHYDTAWIKKIIKNREENWFTSSQPTYYVRQHDENVTMVEFYLEGIVFKRVIRRDD